MYTTVNRAKLHPVLSQVDTDELTNLLEAGADYMEKYCDRVFSSASYTETHDGNGMKFLYLNNYPEITLTSVTITDVDNSTETILGSQFRVEDTTGRIMLKHDNTSNYCVFPMDYSNISVSYTAGYSTIPDDLQEANILLALRMYSTYGSKKNPSFQQERMGEHSFTRIDPNLDLLTPQIKSILDGYRRYDL